MGVLHGLWEVINNSCSFKYSMVGFNPFLTSSFSGYPFWCGNRWGSLSLTATWIAFVLNLVFPSAHTLGLMEETERAPCSWKQRHRPCSIYPSPKGWRRLWHDQKLMWKQQSPGCSLKNNWNNNIWFIQRVPLQKCIGEKVSQGLQQA